MPDFILLLKTMDRGRNALAEMPRNWTTKYQGANEGSKVSVAPVHRILKDALIESKKDSKGYWTGFARIRSELLKPIFGN